MAEFFLKEEITLITKSVQVMNAGPLPENPYLSYRPHNSFDERGYLRQEAYEAKVNQGCAPLNYLSFIYVKFRH